MNAGKYGNSQNGFGLRLISVILALALLPILVLAQAPQWWSSRGVLKQNVTPNDYAAVNQGQVKNIAVKAVEELDANLPGGAGTTLHDLAVQLSATTSNTNDYAAVNLGQMKTIAKPFYDRLHELKYTDTPLGADQKYPWDGKSTSSNDYTMANIGQVKNLFSFNLALTGTNGLPDWWQKYYFDGIVPDPNALAPSGILFNGSPATILQAYQNGLNPVDFYNGAAPILTITSGNNQTGSPGSFVSAPLVVKVKNSRGDPLAQAPVKFTAMGGILQATQSGSSGSILTMSTNAQGYAIVYLQLPSIENFTCFVSCMPGTGEYPTGVMFTESSGTFGSTTPPPTFPPDDQPNNPLTPPILNFVKVDLSDGVTDRISSIAIDDSNNGAYCYINSNQDLMVTTWTNGQVNSSFDTGLSLLWDYYKSLPWPNSIPNLGETLAFRTHLGSWSCAVSANGTVYGDVSLDVYYYDFGANEYWPYYYPTPFAAFKFCNSLVQQADDFDWGILTWENFLQVRSSVDACSADGSYIGACYYYEESWQFASKCGGTPVRIEEPYYITAPADNGYALASDGNGLNMIWDGSGYTTTGSDDRLISTNNAGDAIGWNFSGAFFWNSNIDHILISSLIPNDYQGQISGINPLRLSNANSLGVVHILMTGTFTDPTDGTQSRRIYELSGAHDAMSQANCDFREVKLPEGLSLSDIRGINANGVMVFIHNNSSSNFMTSNARMAGAQSMATESASSGSTIGDISPIEFVTPAGDPVKTPHPPSADPANYPTNIDNIPDGTNEFLYSNANPGVLGIKLKAKVPGIANLGTTKQSKFAFEVEDVGDSTKAWDTANPNGKPTVNGDYLEAKVTFTTLPKNNSDFGLKTAKILYDGKVVAEQKYEVFYRRTATNHPPSTDPYDISEGDTPNIFFYSVQVLKPGGDWGANIAYQYVSEIPKAHVKPMYTEMVGWGYVIFLGGGQFGIDPIGAIAHENKHVFNHFVTVWNYQKFIAQNDDTDADGLKDSWEIQQWDNLSKDDDYFISEYDEPLAKQEPAKLPDSIRTKQSWHVLGPNY